MRSAIHLVNPVVDEKTEAAIFAKVPKSEQILMPWRSIIHWPEAGRRYYDNRFRWVVPVTCGVCRIRRDRRIKYVAETELFSDENLSPKGEKFTGLCIACVSRRCQLEATLQDGSGVSPWEITKEGMPIICGKCSTAQFLRLDHSVDINNFAWSCISCGYNIGEQLHPKGAKVFWLNYWLKRALAKGKKGQHVPFACAQCGNNGLVQASHIWLKNGWVKQWLGRCSDCYRNLGHIRKITGDFCLIPSRSIVLYSRRKERHVPVLCGLQNCGKENQYHIASIKKGRGATGYCNTHTHSEIITRAPRQSQNSSVTGRGALIQQSSIKNSTKKRPGPVKGSNAIITEERIREAYRHLGKYAPQEKIAEFLKVDARSIRLWQKAQGLSYPQLRKRFTETGSS